MQPRGSLCSLCASYSLAQQSLLLMLQTSQHFLVLLVVPQQTLPVAQQILGLPVPEHVATQFGGERGCNV